MRPRLGLLIGVVAIVAGAAVACGASSNSGDAATPKSSAAAPRSRDGAPPDADGGAKADRPFARSTAEATELISDVVDKRHSTIAACVREFRVRKKVANKVAISFGIDQEGKVLGVTSKGKEDSELKTCVQAALKGAAFPRSHAGVITVTKTYEDIVVD